MMSLLPGFQARPIFLGECRRMPVVTSMQKMTMIYDKQTNFMSQFPGKTTDVLQRCNDKQGMLWRMIMTIVKCVTVELRLLREY